LEPWEKEAIIDFHLKNPLGGHRRLTFIMLDVEASTITVPVESQAVAQGDGL
jgi:hypothetical protein